MKALSIVHPAATRIVEGKKILEIRYWLPPSLPLLNLLIIENHRRLAAGEIDQEGLALAVIDIVSAHPWTREEAERDGHEYATGYFAWVIQNVRPLPKPFRAVAQRGIYEVNVNLIIGDFSKG
jgi:hypothetical protein